MTNAQAELLKDLDAGQVAEVLALGCRIQLSRGSELFSLGSRADNLYLVQRGRISLTLPMKVRGSEEEVLVEERGPGQTVGWSAMIPPYRFTLRAVAPLETEVIALSRDTLKEYFTAHPAVGQLVTLNLATIVGQRLQLFQAMWMREMQRMIESHCT